MDGISGRIDKQLVNKSIQNNNIASMESSVPLFHTPARKSFRTHQKVKRNCTKPICCMSTLLLLVLYLAYRWFFPGQDSLNSVQTIKNAMIHNTSSVKQAYLQAYCQERGNCEHQDVEALAVILSLIEHSHFALNEKDVISQPHSSARNELTYNTVQQPLESAINGLQNGQIQIIKQSSGHSKLIQVPLQIVKHPKITTPATLSLGQQFRSFFTRSSPYDGIDHIVEGGNWYVWQPNTQNVSIGVRSNRQFRPTTVQIILERAQNEELSLFGLTITLEQKAVLTDLGQFEVKKGINRMNCLKTECRDYYDSLLFQMGEVEVINIKVFQSIKMKDASQ